MKKVPSIKELEKVASSPDVWIWFLYRRISVRITRIFLHTSITPNQISIISIFIAVLGGVLLSIGEFWFFVMGGLCFIFSTLLDGVDGEVARYKKMTSRMGERLETLNYCVTHLSMYIGLVWGVYRSLGNSLVLLFGLPMILLNLLTNPRKLKNIAWEINALITENDYIGYWIISGAILDLFMPKITVYSFSMSYLMIFILIMLFVGFLKLILTLILDKKI